jgi:predicted transcriptional regulator
MALTPVRLGLYSKGMTTTVHLPPDLLERVDRRAGEMGMSRNRYIREALAKALRSETAWSAGFLEMLKGAASDSESQRAVDEVMRVVRSRRTRKGPPPL